MIAVPPKGRAGSAQAEGISEGLQWCLSPGPATAPGLV